MILNLNLKTVINSSKLAYMNNGGAYILIDAYSYNSQNNNDVSNLTNLINQNIKNNTYIISIDFVTLNKEINFFHPNLIKYTLFPTGLVTVSFELFYVNLSVYEGTFSTIRIIIEIIFCFLVLIYCIIFYLDIKKIGDEIYHSNNKKIRKLR